MTSCVVRSCVNYENPVDPISNDILYHSFPEDTVLKESWIKELNQEGFEPNVESAICSLHFTKECYLVDDGGMAHLKADAVPTQFEFETVMETTTMDEIRCCAARCNNVYQEDSPITFHSFPVDQPDICDQWLMAMNVTQVAADSAVLCSEHFDDSCFVTEVDGHRLIMANAVPTIFFDVPEGEQVEPTPAENSEVNQTQGTLENGDTLEMGEASVDLVEKHDSLVTGMNEATARLMELVKQRSLLEKTKRDLDLLLRVVIDGTKFDRNNMKAYTAIIRSVDELAQQVVVDCLAPCVALAQPLVPE